MLKIYFTKILQVFFLITFTGVINAQSFGFGCLGFVSGYGGYSYQSYNPGTLGEAVQRFNLSHGAGLISDFGKAQGYRIGINIIRAKFGDLFVSGKGYYQLLSDDKEFSFTENNTVINSELDLDLKNWGLGVDVGVQVTSSLSWKIFDGAIHFNSASLTDKPNLSDNTTEIHYANDSPEIGYSLGTGFIISIAEDFLSLEGTFSYTVLKIEKMTDLNMNEFFLGGDKDEYYEKDFIKTGGFSAVLQLNLGFPL